LFIILAGNLKREAIMNKQKGLTLTEVMVVIIAIMVLLLLFVRLYIMPGDGETGSRAVCLQNIKRLQGAWFIYAESNNGLIVCGEAYSGVKGNNGVRTVSGGIEPHWAGDDVNDSSLNKQISKKQQISAIKSGALYPYLNPKSEKYYRCPHGDKGEMRTYAIVDSMNGTFRGLEDKKFDNIPLYIKTTTDINSPAKRIVFIDVGRATKESFAVYYDKEQWWNPAPLRHDSITNLSFADGHVECWKWTGEETIANGKLAKPKQNLQPTTQAGLEDLHKFQKGVWGRLGY
jgi:prepilin-type processing-associated H-X9-DG protein